MLTSNHISRLSWRNVGLARGTSLGRHDINRRTGAHARVAIRAGVVSRATASIISVVVVLACHTVVGTGWRDEPAGGASFWAACVAVRIEWDGLHVRSHAAGSRWGASKVGLGEGFILLSVLTHGTRGTSGIGGDFGPVLDAVWLLLPAARVALSSVECITKGIVVVATHTFIESLVADAFDVCAAFVDRRPADGVFTVLGSNRQIVQDRTRTRGSAREGHGDPEIPPRQRRFGAIQERHAGPE